MHNADPATCTVRPIAGDETGADLAPHSSSLRALALGARTSFTASSANSRLNFRRCIHALRFKKNAISVSAEPAAAQTAVIGFNIS
jgi:hypothetical protein